MNVGLKESLSEQYAEEKQQALDDYPIFMAIAEDIGYDATGKPTNNNELDFIGEELARFIDAINSGNDSFFLGSDVDKNKVFLVQCSALNERLDSEYYQPNHYQDLILLKNSPYRNDVLDRVCNRIVDGPFGSSIKASDYVERGIPFIRVADVTKGEGSIKTDDLIFITEEAHERIIRSKVIPNDVVIAKTGATMGAASLVPASIPEANIRGDLAVLSLNKNDCIPRYVVIYINTNIGQRLFWRLDSGGTRGRVVIGNLKKYPIVIPPKNIQEELIKKMDNAYALKKQKEEEAQRSLDSIDDYLLSELGVNLVEPEENTIRNRVFYRSLKMLSGGRVDPYFYKNIFLETLKSIKESKYPNKTLGQIIKSVINGYDYRDFCDSGRSYLRVSNIRKDEFDLEEVKFIPKFLIEKDITLIKDDLLITRKGSYGISVVVDESISQAVISSEIFRLRFLNLSKINPYYISAYLNSKVGQIYFDRIKTGAIMGHISQDVLHNTPIIIPPLDKQLEIVQHIDEIRNRAKQLRQEAEADLEKAKQEVEAMILGIE